MTTARLYGRFGGNTSLAVVTRGFESALKDAGILTGTSNVETEESEDDDRAGADARHGIYVGPLGHMGEMMKRGIHQHHWLMVTPNSDRLPQDMIQMLRTWHQHPGRHLMAPSRWAARVVEDELHHHQPVEVVPHGVSAEFQPSDSVSRATLRNYEEGLFRVLHFSTSARQRKGTLELIEAWRIAHLFGGGARLLCVMDTEARSALEETMADEGIEMPPGVTLGSRVDFPPATMARELLAHAHVVCQPSRGEGFGLVPLEALACGVPVVATAVTGHAEYMSTLAVSTGSVPGMVRVPTGDWSPIDDLPGSRAPSVSPTALAYALGQARYRWPRLQEEAMHNSWVVRRDWAWGAQLADLIRQLRIK